MSEPLVSVIIPAYKQAEFLGDAIRSVLEQTYANVEAIVVDDASPDHTAEVVAGFNDPRLRYIRHDRNRMLSAARNTGMRAARGEIFALLDADDYFAPEKLAMHVELLARHPELGVSYNGRYDLQCSSQYIRNAVRVPATVTLADLVLGFPFTPSDTVVRKEWALAVDGFDESYLHFSEDLDFNCRLALAGCQFGGIDRCLGYRRLPGGKVIRNTRQRLEGSLHALDKVFADPRTTPEAHARKAQAYANNYIVWGIHALEQFDTATGLEFLHTALTMLPDLLAGNPDTLTTQLLYDAIYDEGADPAKVYQDVAEQLTDDFAVVKQRAGWAIARGWLIRGYRALIWGPYAYGEWAMAEAGKAGAVVDNALVSEVAFHLRSCERERGVAAAVEAARRIDAAVHTSLPGAKVASFAGVLHLARAFEHYNASRNAEVRPAVLDAIRSDPRHLLNRGALSILVRSTVQPKPTAGRPRAGGDQP